MKKAFFVPASLRIVVDDSISTDPKTGAERIEIPSPTKLTESTGATNRIKGKVIITATKAVHHATELSIRFRGGLDVDVSGVTHWVTPDVPPSYPVQTSIVDSTVILWRKSGSSDGGGDGATPNKYENGTFEAGEHEFPFVVYLHANAPSATHLSYGRIRYSLKAKLTRSGLSADVTSNSLPLQIFRVRPKNDTITEKLFETRFHKIKVRFSDELALGETQVKVSAEISVKDKEAVGCLAAVKMALVERRCYSCGLPDKSMVYKEENHMGKGAKYKVDNSKDPSKLDGSITSQEMHAKLNFPLAASALEPASHHLPPPIRFSLIVPIEGANLSLKLNELRVSHRLMLTLEMDEEVWGGDPQFSVYVPASVRCFPTVKPREKKGSFSSSHQKVLSSGASFKSIESATSSHERNQIPVPDGLGIMIPGHSLSRAASAENLKPKPIAVAAAERPSAFPVAIQNRIRGQSDPDPDAVLSLSYQAQADAFVPKVTVGSPSHMSGKSYMSSPVSPVDFSWNRGGTPELFHDGASIGSRGSHDHPKRDLMPALDQRSRSNSAGSNVSKDHHANLPLTPKSMDMSPPRSISHPFNSVTTTSQKSSPTLSSSKSMPYMSPSSVPGSLEDKASVGRIRSNSDDAIKSIEESSADSLGSSLSSTKSSPRSQVGLHRQPHIRARSRSGSNSNNGSVTFRGYGAPTASPNISPAHSMSELPESPAPSPIPSIAIVGSDDGSAKSRNPLFKKIPFKKSISNILGSSFSSSSPSVLQTTEAQEEESSFASLPFNTTSSSAVGRRFRPMQDPSKRSVSPLPSRSNSADDDMPPRRSIDSQQPSNKSSERSHLHVHDASSPPRRSFDDRRQNPPDSPDLDRMMPIPAAKNTYKMANAFGIGTWSSSGSIAGKSIGGRATPANGDDEEEGDDWALVDGVYEFKD
ncbi:hypothetical protein HDU97_000593 [Phlyctochytrium planicorne]|nr:hypothetical protein HDU97_000593 [Phlyctochytrium planicorne]